MCETKSGPAPTAAWARYRRGFGLRRGRWFVDFSWGWRWRWLLRHDEGFKVCVLGVLLEVGRFPNV